MEDTTEGGLLAPGMPQDCRIDRMSEHARDFDIETIKPPSLPPLRPRLRRRHARTGGTDEAKEAPIKCKPSAPQVGEGAVPPGAQTALEVARAAAAAAAAQAEALEDAMSHVSASAGRALSHIPAWTEPNHPFCANKASPQLADKPRGILERAETAVEHDLSGMLESQSEMMTNDVIDAKAPPAGKKVGVGDTLGGRFALKGLLGAGAFGQVFLAEDVVKGGHVAVKVQGAGNRMAQVVQDEIALLNIVANCRRRRLRSSAKAQQGGVDGCGDDCVVEIKGAFALRDSVGKQVCLALEPLGPSLLDLIIDYSYGGCPLSVVAWIMRDVLAGLDFLHSKCKIIHTDIKPENVLLRIAPAQSAESPSEWWRENRERVDGGKGDAGEEAPQRLRKGWSSSWPAPECFRAKLVDLGNACLEDRPLTDDVQTIEYRCPEVVLGAGFTSKADVWSAACMAFELITGEYLFDPQVLANARPTCVDACVPRARGRRTEWST